MDDDVEDQPMSDGDPEGREPLWVPPPLYALGHRPASPSSGALIWEISGRVLRWTGIEWADDLPEWLLLQYSVQRHQARKPAQAARSQYAWRDVYEWVGRFRDASPESGDAVTARQKLREMAAPFAGEDGWQDSWLNNRE